MANFDFKVYYRVEILNSVANTLSRRTDLRETNRPLVYNAVLKSK